MSSLNNTVVDFHRINIIAMVSTHNTRVMCNKEYGSLVCKSKGIPTTDVDKSDIYAVYEKHGLGIALRCLKTFGEYPKEIHEFAMFCMKQAQDLFVDEKRFSCEPGGFGRVGFDIWSIAYEDGYKSATGVSPAYADAIASAAAAVALYDGYYSDTVNTSYSDENIGIRDVSPSEITNAARAVPKVIENQKVEFRTIINKIYDKVLGDLW